MALSSSSALRSTRGRRCCTAPAVRLWRRADVAARLAGSFSSILYSAAACASRGACVRAPVPTPGPFSAWTVEGPRLSVARDEPSPPLPTSPRDEQAFAAQPPVQLMPVREKVRSNRTILYLLSHPGLPPRRPSPPPVRLQEHGRSPDHLRPALRDQPPNSCAQRTGMSASSSPRDHQARALSRCSAGQPATGTGQRNRDAADRRDRVHRHVQCPLRTRRGDRWLPELQGCWTAAGGRLPAARSCVSDPMAPTTTKAGGLRRINDRTVGSSRDFAANIDRRRRAHHRGARSPAERSAPS